jgi:hypothetical protein
MEKIRIIAAVVKIIDLDNGIEQSVYGMRH